MLDEFNSYCATAMQLLDMMHHFRREEKDADLAIQLEVSRVETSTYV